MALKISNTWNKVLRWLLKATSKDSMNLSVIHVEENWATACDKFRLHAAEGRPGWPQIGSALDEGNWDFAPFKADDTEVQALGTSVNYPDVLQVLPNQPTVEIVIDGGFLVDALAPMRGSLVRLRVCHQPGFPSMLEIFGKVDDQKVYVLLADNRGPASEWRPERAEGDR